jgi:hypothetical protein
MLNFCNIYMKINTKLIYDLMTEYSYHKRAKQIEHMYLLLESGSEYNVRNLGMRLQDT